MNLLFVHGFKMIRDSDNNLYTGGSYNSEIWLRYQRISSSLTVCARMESTIYNPFKASLQFNKFDTESINFVELPNLMKSSIDFLNASKRRKAISILEREVLKSDIIIVRLPDAMGYKTVKLAIKHNKPYLIEVVGCAFDSLYNHSFKGKLIAIPNFLKMRQAVKKAPYVVYVTNEFLQKRYPSSGISISCSDVSLKSMDFAILENRIKKIKAKNKLTLLIIGTIGDTNVSYKGQKFVIRALGELKKTGFKNFEYQLVGGGSQNKLKKLAIKYGVEKEVLFLGSMPHSEIFKWLDEIDLYIQPSLTEGLPRSLIEAMSRGLPSIGSNVGGIFELLSKDSIVRKSNYKEIKDKIKSLNLLENKVEAKRNFKQALKYQSKYVEKRRNDFFLEFVNRSKNSSNT